MRSSVSLAGQINPKGLGEETHSHRHLQCEKYSHLCLKLTLCSMICVKLLSRRDLGPRPSVSAHHLRMALISERRPRSCCGGVRLLQNNLSTPSSSVALLSTLHTFLSTVAMVTVWQGWAVSKALWSLVKTPLHAHLCYVALILPFWSSFGGDIKPGGIQDVPYKTLCYCLTGWDGDSLRTDAPVLLGRSLPAHRYHLIICSPQIPNRQQSQAHLSSTLCFEAGGGKKNNELHIFRFQEPCKMEQFYTKL